MRRRTGVLLAAALVIGGGAAAAVVVTSGPTGACFNPLVAHYRNEQGSMAPTLVSGDYVVAPSVQASSPLTRGEIVVFQAPASWAGDSQSPPFIKRVIGLPGETVSFANGHVVINGTRLDEPYLTPGMETDPQGTASSWVLGPAELFVLGNRRANSVDSRMFGAIPISSVAGHATAICSPDSRKTALP
jgi:signal peptidase I